ncbi:Hypothetical predicted protein [Olea europaea subsp. europaea]|uniref:Uncharacterized protein n=1 Tax=Olea europaea subsp. europaea TaxID=158383 RepID=A0A8S0U059_OLEEU|nr:Hypothetical predicted protein [Olea europaea subsp. europaea]
MANKEKAEMKAQVDELNSGHKAKVATSCTGEAVVENFVAHFHEMADYDGLGLYWRGVAYDEILKRLANLCPQMDLAPLKEEYIPAEASTLVGENEELDNAMDP